MQAHRVGIVVDLQKPFQRGQRLDSAAYVVGSKHVGGDFRRYPVEQRQIQQQRAIFGRQIAQQPFAQPVGHHASIAHQILHRDVFHPGMGLHVAVGPQGNWPSFGAFRQIVQLAPRQLVVEEARDLRLGEAQLIGRNVEAPVGEHCAAEVEPWVFAHSQGDVKIAWAVQQEEVDRGERHAVRQPLDFVQYQQTRCRVRFDGCRQQFHAAARPLAIVAAIPSVALCGGHVQAGDLEGIGQIHVENASGVVFVQSQPCD